MTVHYLKFRIYQHGNNCTKERKTKFFPTITFMLIAILNHFCDGLADNSNIVLGLSFKISLDFIFAI